MKMQSELLGRLHKLKPQDRAWIVERLSEQEKAQLLSTVATPEPMGNGASQRLAPTVDERSPAMELKSTDVFRSLSRVEPRQVAAIAKSEPAWLIAVIVSAQQATWNKALLDALPTAQRSEVERIQLNKMCFGAALTESVTRLILTRCHDGNVPVESAFERLVERLSSSRTKKRLTLHL